LCLSPWAGLPGDASRSSNRCRRRRGRGRGYTDTRGTRPSGRGPRRCRSRGLRGGSSWRRWTRRAGRGWWGGRGHGRRNAFPNFAKAVFLGTVFASRTPELRSGVTVRVHVAVGVRVGTRGCGCHGDPAHRGGQCGCRHETDQGLLHGALPSIASHRSLTSPQSFASRHPGNRTDRPNRSGGSQPGRVCTDTQARLRRARRVGSPRTCNPTRPGRASTRPQP
jgi:hypothetical protein